MVKEVGLRFTVFIEVMLVTVFLIGSSFLVHLYSD